MPKDLFSFLHPKSIAIIGASRDPKKVGGIVLKNLIESKFKGNIYPVNPTTNQINNLPCYPNYSSIPNTPDLAIIALPSNLVIETLDQVGKKGTKNVVIFSAGFKEIGQEGLLLEKKLIEISNQYSLNILGPNCLGFVFQPENINATFGEKVTASGNIHFISQSGAIATSVFDWCNSINLGFTSFITLGNKSVLNENDFLSSIASAEDQHPIGLYLESISNGREFIQITEKLSQNHPIFIIKPGKSEAAAKAMQSHTGAISGSDDVLSAVLDHCNIIRCHDLEDFFDISKALSWGKIPQGPRLAIISNAGGPAVISADATSEYGLTLASFDTELSNQLTQILPRSASIHNPVDVLGDALSDRYASATELILKSNQADALLVILTPQMMTQVKETAESISKLKDQYQKPIFCSFIGGTLVKDGEQILNQYHLPSFRFPEQAIQTISQLWQWQKNNQYPQVAGSLTYQPNPIIKKATDSKLPALDPQSANLLFKQIGFTTPPSFSPNTVDESKVLADQIGYPVVLKINSPELIHKAKSKGVIANIYSDLSLEKSWGDITTSKMDLSNQLKHPITIQLQKQVNSGIEIILGGKKDPNFGPFIIFGVGGKLAEILNEKIIFLAPKSTTETEQILKKSKLYPLISPHPQYSQLITAITNFSSTLTSESSISDMEINPIIINDLQMFAVDCKVIFNQTLK